MRPLLPRSRAVRRTFICRILACGLTAVTLWMLLLSPPVSSSPIGSPNTNARRHDTEQRVLQSEHIPYGPQPSQTSHRAFSDADEGLVAPVIPQHASSTPEHPQSQGNIVHNVLGLAKYIEDEARVNGLLAPLPTTGGEALLRDLALRTRVFREALAAWETIHFSISSAGILTQHQSILPALRKLSSAKHREAMAIYDRFRVFINAFSNRLFPYTSPAYGEHIALHASFHQGGRGIVFTAGDDQAQYLRTSIPALRRLGCKLPIEVMYLGDGDLSEDSREMLENMEGVLTRDMSPMVNDKGWDLKGWAAKPFAILLSSFREVVFIDADALLMIDPEKLFTDDLYSSTGALFFKDRNLMPESKRTWLREILPKPISHHVKENRMWTGESGHMQDSGVVVIDKWKHFVALLLTTRLNGPDRDGNEEKGKKGVYEMVYGDKETFWISWELAGDLGYAFYDGLTGNMGSLKKNATVEDDDNEEKDQDDKDKQGKDKKNEEKEPDDGIKDTICSPQLLHFDRNGKPLWFNGWVANQKFEDSKFEPFEVYMREPAERLKKGAKNPWDLKDQNIVCLRSEEYFGFEKEEQDVLNGLLESAREVSESSS